jgi:type II secretory pathway pseudopilin PulG
VIAIIAILAALLLPVISKAKSRARRIECMSNERQLSLTWQLYASDHNDLLPPNGYGLPETLGSNRLWVVGDEHIHPEFFTNLDYLLDPKYAAFAEYLKSAAIYKCPEDHSTVDLGGQAYPKVRSYSLNGFFHWESPQPDALRTNPRYWNFAKMSDLAHGRPSEIFSFLDVSPGNICHSAFVVQIGVFPGLFYHLPSVQHENRGVLSFADGHTEAHHWVDPRTIDESKVDWIPNHFTVWLQNDADLDWLAAHASALK